MEIRARTRQTDTHRQTDKRDRTHCHAAFDARRAENCAPHLKRTSSVYVIWASSVIRIGINAAAFVVNKDVPVSNSRAMMP